MPLPSPGHRARHYLMTKQHLIQVYYYPMAVRAKKYHKPSDLKQQKLLSHNSGSWKSKWRCRHGHIRKNPSFPPSGFWWFAGSLWCSLACSCVTSVLHDVHPVCLCVFTLPSSYKNFPDGSESKESSGNSRDPSSIPWSGRSTGEGNGYYPLQYSCLENPQGLKSLGGYIP